MSIAQQVRDDFVNARKTVSVGTLAKKAGGVTTQSYMRDGGVHYCFPDGSHITTAGIGRSHKTSVDGGPYQRTSELKRQRDV